MTEAALPQQQRYTAVAIALHWLIAAGIIGMIGLGWVMDDLPDQQAYPLIQLHKSFGITILMLSIARVVWRLMNPPPPEPPMPGWQRSLALLVHVGLYVLIIAMPLTGWIMASASSDAPTRFFYLVDVRLPGIPGLPSETRKGIEESFEFAHSNLQWVIIAMLVLHIAGAVKHQFIDKNGLLARMAPGLFGRTAGPPDNGHGLLWALGAPVLVLAIVFSVALAPSTTSTTTTTTTSIDGQPPVDRSSPAPFWAVDPAQSSIVFKSAYMGRPFEGRFQKWDASIQFDPANPKDARIRVVIPTISAKTGEPYFDDSISQGDWFDSAKHPEAVFEVNEGVFKDSETEYEATGVLTIKGARYPVRLPFTLEINGATAKMHGETTLQRLAIDIGKDTLAEAKGDEEWVQNDVRVVVVVVATRQ
jgi:cytochrome b561/polyisoprenoid-binding protein YceI